MRRWPLDVPAALVAAVVAFQAWSLRAELLTVGYLNDSSFQSSYLRWATNRLTAGRTPFDGLFTPLGLGFPIFHHYQVAPQLISSIPATVFGADNTFRWVGYLLLVTWPIPVFWAARQFGLSRWGAAAAAAMSPFLLSAPGYGFERGSYLWRGYGMWTQLWGMWLMPLALGAAWRALHRRRSIVLPGILLALLVTSHVLTGYLTGLVIAAFAIVAGWRTLRPRLGQLATSIARAALLGAIGLALSAWLLVPATADRAWTRNSLQGGFWLNSYGARKVSWWLATGRLFDDGRWPVVTALAGVGLVAALWRSRRADAAGIRAILALFALSLFLFFGRPTASWFVDALPVHDELFLHRMIVGVHLGGIFLAGLGVQTIGELAAWALRRARSWWLDHSTLGAAELRAPSVRPTVLLLAAAGLVALGAPLWTQARTYDALDASWIHQQRAADASQGRDFRRLATSSEEKHANRIFAGGMYQGQVFNYRIGFVPGAIDLTNDDLPGLGFTGRIPAITEPTEAHFDPLKQGSYELFNVGLLILPTDYQAPPFAQPVASTPMLRSYALPTSGWLRVVDTTSVIHTTVDDLPSAVAPFVAGSDVLAGRYPLIGLNGRAPGTPSWTAPDPPTTPAGSVTSVSAHLNDGDVSGRVTMARRAVVVHPVTFHPRWRARVDGKTAHTLVVGPGLLGVEAGPGPHHVTFRYEPVSIWVTAGLFAGGLLVATAVAFADRPLRRRAAPGH